MPVDPNQRALLEKPAVSRYGMRLIVAVALIAISIVALALVDHFHPLPARFVTAPHEPAQALITTPLPGAEGLTSGAGPTLGLPAPQTIANNEIPAMPAHAVAGAAAAATAKSYIVQLGVFNSPANAQALQKQLQRAGINARLETRVQLGPFKNKHDADKAITRVKKLGIEGMVVGL